MPVGPERGWDLAFRRLVNDWEVERVAKLLGKIGGISINTNFTDKMVRKHFKKWCLFS